MSSVCAEQQKFQFQFQLPSSCSKILEDINGEMCSDSPRFSFAVESLLQKFLPFNGEDVAEEDGDPYSSDHFRMYEFKVWRCTRSRSHDWTDCPFAHPGEKARRRDPRRFHYSGTMCPDFRRGGCDRGDGCEFAHGVFECWLHPARYRTEACKDGKNCKRKVCFFAHSPRELRLLPPVSNFQGGSCSSPNKRSSTLRSAAAGSNHGCLFCHCGGAATSSPTSTLIGMSHLSPPLSPPLSPVKPQSLNGFSPISRYNPDPSKLNGVISYKDSMTELMNSIESMNIDELNAALAASASRQTIPWIDVSSLNTEDQLQFVLSPSTPNVSAASVNFSVNNKGNADNGWASASASASDPDLGWVNDLLM
ncbi:zinc finger CCCH domain-containing protein 2-like [Cucurbita pepo subsp. pepo]|uniref:zinc finger CCCH domain-containing protein 2-like n=1 Tax=Cucurbita pepo subsp. pepo TaxID=3664 RepID=UPI000C9D4137|nr:zinc finger CCCH domain-containing protein 2-like [Cucurbita pepo subsp. pepo]